MKYRESLLGRMEMRFVPAKSLTPGMVLGRDILSPNQNRMLRYGVTLTKEYIAYIINNGYMGAYIQDELTDDIEIPETISMATFEKSVNAVKSEDIGKIVDVAGYIVDEISSMRHLSVDLIDLRSYDDYTFHHSVNVAVYATVIGKKLGLSDVSLTQLCQAGLCHDLGKVNIPIEVLNKPGKLSDEEYDIIKNHPKKAFDMLSSHIEVSPFVRQAVLMHHENENGSGYPLGREGGQIPLFAKILHVADVYDALTSKRAYKEPYAPIDAFSYLMGGVGRLFDKEIVETLTTTIPAFPAGIEVGLSNGEHGVVIEHTDDTMRPVIRLIPSGERIDLSWDPRYDEVYISESGVMALENGVGIEELNENRQAVRELKKTIVIVDDAKMSRMQATQAITGDYKLLSMETGIELLNYMSDHSAPDLVIMDVELPMMSGIDTVKKMRQKGFLYTPVMFFSANKDKNTILQCKDVGAVDYVVKPAKPAYLNERVEIALSKYSG